MDVILGITIMKLDVPNLSLWNIVRCISKPDATRKRGIYIWIEMTKIQDEKSKKKNLLFVRKN